MNVLHNCAKSQDSCILIFKCRALHNLINTPSTPISLSSYISLPQSHPLCFVLPPSIFQVALFHLSLCLYILTSISLSDSFLPLSHLHISVYHILYRISSINISFSSMHVFIFLICTYVLYMYVHLYSTVVYVRAYISLPTSDVLLRSLCLSN